MLDGFEPALKWDCVRRAVAIAEAPEELGHNDKMEQFQLVACFVGCAAEWALGFPDDNALVESGGFAFVDTSEICQRIVDEMPDEIVPDDDMDMDDALEMRRKVIGLIIPLLLELLNR